MPDMILYKHFEIEPKPMVTHGSWGQHDVGTHASTMDIYWTPNLKGKVTREKIRNGHGMIEWNIGTLDECEHIGIWTEEGNLTDYDGIMALPLEAAEILEMIGIKVSEEFKDK